ncbi:RND efflux system, outer membrane lipoprotein, NodT family [Methylophaga thiooxydans]|uniref:RND efflux system, outer membrane lipoprotein, NodT family n=1 Tax=Methylophaga thiooxydans TaxID=392484 RepID=A0A0A0BFD9_9GAMM|nr:TolC family protein [Methylophaga thiooxydans]KGM06397.1 RND efflux system, outer membrane lipoprotein, NodT family [Methylophaga thiooxydans]
MPAQEDYLQQIQHEQSQVTPWTQINTATTQTALTDLIQSESLDQLLETAFANNPSLQQTLLTLQIRQAQLSQTDAARLPQISAGFSAANEQDTTASYSSNISINWQLDLWGKLKADSQAASLDIEQQQLLYQSARDTLASQVINAWLNLTATQHAIEIEQKRLSTLTQNETFILQRYRSGIGNLEDLDNARSAVSQSKASLENNRESYRQQHRQFRQLLGQSELPSIIETPTYPEVQLSLADMPQQTLARRPDLQAAYIAIQAASLRTEVAYKDLLPSLDLGAALTDSASTPHESLLASPVWSLLGQLTAPLFQGGELRAATEIAELNTAYSYQSYRETLLTAINEIEQTLSLETTLDIQQQHIRQALKNSQNSLEQYQRSYRNGLVDILDLLAVQQQTYDLEAQLDDLIYQQLSNRINLGLALGLGVTP